MKMDIKNYPLLRVNYKRLEVDNKNYIFHVPSSSVFELCEDSHRVLNKLENKEDLNSDEKEIFNEFMSLNLVGNQFREKDVKVQKFPAKALVLNVTSGCNLSCTYCYKEDLTSLKNRGNMTMQMAKDSIDLFYNESPDLKNYSITFFGGEPLSNLTLIKQIIEYANDFFGSKGVNIGYALTTNGTLLTKDIIEYFFKNRVDLTVSIDGPEVLHNKTRVFGNGKGTYKSVVKNLSTLLKVYGDRIVPARVTLTRGVSDVLKIWDHLKNDLGFKEIGFAPVSSGENDFFNLSPQEQIKVFEEFKILGNHYVQNAINGKLNGFSNIHRTMMDIHEGRKKRLPCGAGVGLLSVSYKGDIDLCHRFTGSDFKSFGSIKDGLDKKSLSNFLEKRANEKDSDCQSCHARYLCAGGCYHENYIKNKTPEIKGHQYCDTLREWIDFVVASYVKIREKNPSFFDKFLTNKGVKSEIF
ncbi:quinohemoprotein amine dehydrogenase maturation protein [Malaciobacter molluscorum]|uniref:quinohemoprotein amine dehydrogenase maturation protein n=1 Tax=Malaciobacter molluscorum TaxID=1032072 RepID=UPI001D191A5A|nr:quinohemoprotein amine dehydrogenase maturation protein [Malaciobacter molluscorum]